jgi:hypothetical protein
MLSGDLNILQFDHNMLPVDLNILPGDHNILPVDFHDWQLIFL